MATYVEIRNLFNDSALKNRVAVAVIKAAETILNNAAATPDERSWANGAFSRPESEAGRVFMAVLAANSAATVAQIQGVTDVNLQTNVDAAISLFVAADAGN